MTEWTTKAERHVPEEELHAYLDQALSRSQCAEIETHLSGCKQCQGRRATVAALRDRTTALLSELAPRALIVPPSYQALREKQSRRLAIAIWRVRLQRSGLWAAAVVAAVGAGWIARTVLDPHRIAVAPPVLAEAPTPTPAPAGDAVASTPSATVPLELEREATPLPPPVRRSAPAIRTVARNAEVVPAPVFQLVSAITPIPRSAPASELAINSTGGSDPFSKVWRLMQWEDALDVAGSGLPFIEGLPVVGVMLQAGGPGERPLAIVSQQDPSGELIQSIEGPVAKVNEFLTKQGSPEMHSSDFTRTAPDYLDGPGGGVRRSLRILTVTGRLSVDSLNALARVATIR